MKANLLGESLCILVAYVDNKVVAFDWFNILIWSYIYHENNVLTFQSIEFLKKKWNNNI